MTGRVRLIGKVTGDVLRHTRPGRARDLPGAAGEKTAAFNAADVAQCPTCGAKMTRHQLVWHKRKRHATS